MIKTLKVIAFISFTACCSLALAGGPLVLEGPDGSTPVTYQNPTITVHVESGDLNVEVDNAAANAILLEALQLWNDVNTSTIELTINTAALLLEPDIDSRNFDQYIPSIDGSIFNGDDGLNPIVYDSDGEIIDAFFGEGASDHTVGFSASIYTLGGSFFNEGYAVINGKDLGTLGLTDTEFKLLIAHEIGHFFGLDHSQTNINNQETIFGTPVICDTSTPENYPVMYPFICRETESLHADDVSALTALYPETNVNDNFGILEGRFTDASGNAILGANMWAENTSTAEAYSIVSDYLKQGTGYYKLLLPAGSYTLHANSINPIFNGGSSIGPYAFSIFDASFTSPHPISEVVYQGEVESNGEVITITTGQSVNISFSLAGLAVTASPDENDNVSDLFGATSYVTLLLLISLLITTRIITVKRHEQY